MDGYPLQISIPRTETARSTLRFRHTAYLIEIDDCGKLYTRHRRYTNFGWLHGELRRRELGCALPELPPKKAVGNLDHNFVERRRQALEDYLRALLRLPAVMLDDTLWAFLDADLATAVVPRFLCRPHSHAASAECLAQLEKVVTREANIFRICSPAVLKEFVDFVQAEAAGSSVDVPGSGRSTVASSYPNQMQGLQLRLENRVRFCMVLQHLIPHERARQGLVDHGMFGALLTLLSRTTEECEEIRRGGKEPSDMHKKIHHAVTDSLQKLLEGSKGGALLHFCQQDDGLGALRRLANGADSLHPVAASLLWHGLQNTGVVTALVGAPNGLQLLGKLLGSPDLRSKILAALCIGCVVRQEGSLSADDREHCLEALTGMPRCLDEAESDAVQRTANVALDKSTPLALGGSSLPGARGLDDTFSDAGLDAASIAQHSAADGGVNSEFSSVVRASVRCALVPMVEVDRDESIVKLLRNLCSHKELPRLKALLGDAETADSVTCLVLVLLDHFVQQSAEEPAKLRELATLAEQLQHLLEADDEGWTVEGGRQATGGEAARAISEEVRTRAARILIRLDWPTDAETTGEPPPLVAFGQRARMLEVLSRHSAACQESAQRRLDSSREHGELQGNRVNEGGLTEALCVSEARLAEFSRHVATLEEQRGILGREVETSKQAVEGMLASLEHRGIKRGILNRSVDEISKYIGEQSEQEERCAEAQQQVVECDAACRDAASQVEAQRARKKEAEAAIREMTRQQQTAESRSAELARREAELAEVCHNAPAQLEVVQARLADCERRRGQLSDKRRQLSTEAERGERRAGTLKEWIREAEVALQSLAEVKRELQVFQGTLNSELILTDKEVEKLRQLDLRLQPPRPTRLRDARRPGTPRSTENSDAGGGGDGIADDADNNPAVSLGGAAAPSWDDTSAEQDFRTSPHFRSFSKLCIERERLWEVERSWVQDQLTRTSTTISDLNSQLRVQEKQEQQVADEEDGLRGEETTLADFDGHADRHNEARVAAAEALESAQRAASEVGEARGASQMADVSLEKGLIEQREADAASARARETARVEAARTLKVRSELEGRVKELEKKTRSYLQEWRSVELEEHRLALLQKRVAERLEEEAKGRTGLRLEAQRLIDQLHDLDRQLNVAAAAADEAVEENGAYWIPEAAAPGTPTSALYPTASGEFAMGR